MYKYTTPILIFSLFLLSASFLGQVQAAFLKFDSANVSLKPGDTFSINVTVDSGSDQITSAVAHIVFDASLLEAQSVTPGPFFPSVIQNITAGKVSISGLVNSPGTYQTGSGTLGSITFKALKSGTASLSFYCQPILYNSSKIIKNDLNATNVIDCSQNGSTTVIVGSGGSVTKPDDDDKPRVTKIDDDQKPDISKAADDRDKEEGDFEKVRKPLYMASLVILIAFVILILQKL